MTGQGAMNGMCWLVSDCVGWCQIVLADVRMCWQIVLAGVDICWHVWVVTHINSAGTNVVTLVVLSGQDHPVIIG